MRIYQPESTLLEKLAHECLQPSAESVSQKHLNILFDFDKQIVNFDSAWLVSALQRMLTLAVERSPECGEIQVTACCVENALEIEVADVGDTPNEIADVSAFRHGDKQTAGSANIRDWISSIRSRGADFWGVACPQGGMAWTLRLPRRLQAKRAA